MPLPDHPPDAPVPAPDDTPSPPTTALAACLTFLADALWYALTEWAGASLVWLAGALWRGMTGGH